MYLLKIVCYFEILNDSTLNPNKNWLLSAIQNKGTHQHYIIEVKMNTLDYSKGEFSRARTADYHPNQSTRGQLNNNQNLNHPNYRHDISMAQTKLYRGDASQNNQNQYYTGRPAQSYQQYAYRQPHISQEREYLQVPVQQQVPIQRHQQRLHSEHIAATNSFNLPSSYSAQHALYMSQHQEPQPYRRQFLTFRPMMANQISQVAQPNPNYRMDQRMTQSQQNIGDFKIFCPACHQQYYNSQVQQHIEKHYLYNTDQFRLSAFNNDVSADAGYGSFVPLSAQSRFIYPLIQPQEFQCKQLDEVNFLNKYKLHHQEINKKQNNVKVNSESTQFAKPPLQIKSQNTDIYNCFDNIFGDNKFNVSDITQTNTILAKKRELDDWQKLRSQKQGYTIKGKQHIRKNH